jgi:hypothetical protein
MLFENLSQIEV